MRFNLLTHIPANDVAILLIATLTMSSVFMAIAACAGTPEPQIVEVEREVIKEVVVEVPVEVIKEVVVETEIVKEVKVPVEVIKEVIVETEVIKEVEVPVEVVVVKEVVKEVKVPVEVIKEVIVEKEIVKTETPTPTDTPVPTPTPDSDRAALMALYDATDGDSWVRNDKWNTDLPLDQWYGVATNRTGRVTSLDLDRGGDGNRLRGSIPSELGNLAFLTKLDLSDNQLTGSLPPRLGNLASLESLNLYNNQLTGPIPPELGNLTKLVTLHLGNNKLSGSMPPELDNLAILSSISLYGNPLIGPIPPGIDQLARSNDVRISLMDDRAALAALYDATDGDSWVRNDKWNTDLPLDHWYGVATNRTGRVTSLDLDRGGDGNRLRGSIPSELGNLAFLTKLDLSDNQLTGSLPPRLGNLASLESLNLYNNQLTGPIPPELGNLTKLVTLHLGNNKLSGSMPPELDNLAILSSISLYGNPLIGPIPPGIDQLARSNDVRISLMDDRAALAALYDATDGDSWVRNDKWNTDLPLDHWYGVATNRTGRVTSLDLDRGGDGNRLRGSIPSELGNLAFLTKLDLSDNPELSGTVPSELGNLARLVAVYLVGTYIESYSVPLELAGLIACELTNNDKGLLICSR